MPYPRDRHRTDAAWPALLAQGLPRALHRRSRRRSDPLASTARATFAQLAASASAIGIACALVLDPALIVCDEPGVALDVSVQGQFVNLSASCNAERGLELRVRLRTSLRIVRHIADRVAVMYLGRIVEIGDKRQSIAVNTASLHQEALQPRCNLKPGHPRRRAAVGRDPSR